MCRVAARLILFSAFVSATMAVICGARVSKLVRGKEATNRDRTSSGEEVNEYSN